MEDLLQRGWRVAAIQVGFASRKGGLGILPRVPAGIDRIKTSSFSDALFLDNYIMYILLVYFHTRFNIM